MKRIILIAAACAALASCTKAETETVNVTGPSVGTSFEKGQTVTLNVNAVTTTKVTSELNADGQTVDFKWAAEDKIKVTVKGEDAEFTLTSGAGESSAVFEGVMPEFGDTFDVQYPVTDPDIATQNYSSTEAIPHDKMKFTATGCSFASPSFTLTASNAALRLNLYGTDQTISKIVVKDANSNTYTLGFTQSVDLPAEKKDSMAFFIVVPAGEYKFSAEIFDNASTPASICKFEPSAAQTFSPANVLNMPAKEVKKSLPEGALSGEFSVSATVKVHFSQGNLQATYNSSTSSYSWDFAANQYDYIGNAAGNTSIDSQTDGAVVDLFCWSTPATYYGINTSEETSTYSGNFKDWGTAIDDKDTWRTLTSAEWQYLFGSNEKRKGLYAYGVTVAGKTNCVVLYPDGFTGTKVSNYNEISYATAEGWSSAAASGVVCLPSAGYREGSKVLDVTGYGGYWSSSVYKNDSAYDLYFFTGNVNSDYLYRDTGNSVRLVSAAN